MHLIYFDESGNTGNNLSDPEQPIFVLGAMIVAEKCWQAVEEELDAAIGHHFPELLGSEEEIHGGDLRGSRGIFKAKPVTQRASLRDSWLRIAAKHGLKFVYRSIDKGRYSKWMREAFGEGVSINPHIAAFPLLSIVVNHHLHGLGALGMFISDDNKEIVKGIEKSIRLLRLTPGPLKLSQIIEKGFFIDSSKSRVLQLCDICVLHARKAEEVKLGRELKPFDVKGIEMLKAILLPLKENERFKDVIAWLKAEQARDGGK